MEKTDVRSVSYTHLPGRTLWEFLRVRKWELRQYRNSRNGFKAMAWLLGW